MKSFATASIVALLAASPVMAIVPITPLSYSNFDTRSGGSYGAVATPTNDADGSLQLQTTNAAPIAGVNQDKVAIIFTAGGNLGTVGDLNSLSIDAYKSSSPSTSAAADFAYRLQLSGGASLVYENAYQPGDQTVATDTWRSLNLTTGLFWLYDGVTNHNGGSDAHPLSYYTAYANTPITGLQVAYGSGIGAFTGYIDHPTLSFGSGATYSENISVPEPASLALIGCGGVALLMRRRRSTNA